MGKLYDFFSGGKNKNDKGLSKKQVEYDKKLGFGFFFRLLKMRLGKFSASNLIFALCNIFFFVALFAIAGFLDHSVYTAGSNLYPQVTGISQYIDSPVIVALKGLFAVKTDMRVFSTASNILLYGSGAILFFTFGLSTIGLIYNMRNVCTGEHVDTWGDYFYAIKKNWKQGIILGILDIVLILVLMYDIVAYRYNVGLNFAMNVFYFASIIFAIIYYVMRFYLYLKLVTCKMTIGKMFKNAFLLTSLGLKRNFCGLIGAAAFILLVCYCFILLPSFTIILIAMFAVAFLAYIGVYCAWPVLKKYVIDPYYEDHPEEKPVIEDSDDLIFTDRE